ILALEPLISLNFATDVGNQNFASVSPGHSIPTPDDLGPLRVKDSPVGQRMLSKQFHNVTKLKARCTGDDQNESLQGDELRRIRYLQLNLVDLTVQSHRNP